MKKIIILAASVMAMISAASCQKTVVNEIKGDGYLSFAELSLELDETLDTKATSDLPEAGGEYFIFVKNSDGVDAIDPIPYSTVQANANKISLPAGNYTLVARSTRNEVPVAEFDAPVYGTSKEFSITAGEETRAGELVCSLLQRKVTVSYSDEFLAMVTGDGSTTVTVSAEKSLVYALNADKSYETDAGYFAVTGETMTVVFKGSIEGKSQKMTKTFTGLAAKQFRQIKFVKKTNEQGDATFDIEIDALIDDTPLNEDVAGIVGSEESIGDDPAQPKGDGGIRLVPNYTAEEIEAGKNVIITSFVTDENGDEVLYENGEKKISMTIPITAPLVENTPDMSIKLKAVVPGGIKKFTVDIITDNSTFAAAVNEVNASHLDLVNPLAAHDIIYKLVPFPHGEEELLGKLEVPFELDKAQPAISGFPGTHIFDMTIMDAAGSQNTIRVIMTVPSN